MKLIRGTVSLAVAFALGTVIVCAYLAACIDFTIYLAHLFGL